MHGAYENYAYVATIASTADLLVDAGDNIQGSVATTLTNGQCMVDLMKAVGYDVAVPGDHGSTFGGNPTCCAGAVNILSRIDDKLLAGVRERSDYLFRTLSGKKGIQSVTGMGLMLGLLRRKARQKQMMRAFAPMRLRSMP